MTLPKSLMWQLLLMSEKLRSPSTDTNAPKKPMIKSESQFA